MIPYSALNLAERSALPAALRPTDTRAGVQDRIRWWRRRFHRDSRRTFSHWLGMGGLDASDLPGLAERVGDLPISTAFTTPAPWVEVIRRLAQTRATSGAPADASRLAEALPDSMILPFLTLAAGEVAAVVKRLDPHAEILTPQRAVDAACNYLRYRLISIARSATALALNMARLRGELVGPDPESRARDFFARLEEPAFRARVLSDFPVLERRLAQATAATIDAISQLIEDLVSDHDDLSERFALERARVDEIRFGLGDPHKMGRSVAIVSFGATRVVYKPRSLSIDEAFAGLVDWFNGVSPQRLEAPRVLDKDRHGWTEFIEYRECGDAADVTLAFNRTGALLALLQLCGASDLHFENLIYRGPQPIPVDLETTLTPTPHMTAKSKGLAGARRVNRRSVLTVGYLPNPFTTPEGRLDLSAAGLFEDQKSPFKSNVVGDMTRDDVKAAARQGVLSPVGNVPRLGGLAQPAARHVDEIVSGFASAYETLLAHKETLLAAAGPLQAFRSARIRWVARPTVQYATMQVQANHPSLMRDGLDLDMAFADLWSSLEEAPHLRQIIRSEYEDLWNGDVPYFTTSGASHAVEDSQGRVLESFFERSGFDMLEARVLALSPMDRDRQEDLIRLAFAASVLDGGPDQPNGPIPASKGQPPSDEVCLAEAREIGERLLKSEWLENGLPYWFGIRSIDQTGFRADLSGPDLYAGSAGIGVFMAELARATGDRRFRASARRISDTIKAAPASRSVGAYEGAGGLLYAHVRMAELIGRPDPGFIRKQLRLISALLPADQGLDLISGAAGGLVCALRAAEIPAVRADALATAIACADRLLQTEITDDDSGAASWMNAVFKTPITGLSHGATGMALALAQLAFWIGEDRYASAAWRALRFEAGHETDGPHGWRDARPAAAAGSGWCHGAPGMTLGRMEIRKLGIAGAPESLDREVARGLRAIARTGAGGSHCLCHGALGNLEPLAEAGPATRMQAESLLARALEDKREDGWLCGYGRGVETPGLMTGLAGIGLALLRMRDDTVPSALTLQTRAWNERLDGGGAA